MSLTLVTPPQVEPVAIGTAQEVIAAWYPRATGWADALSTSQLVPAAVIYASLYLLFFTLTPTPYRARRYPKWPGALKGVFFLDFFT